MGFRVLEVPTCPSVTLHLSGSITVGGGGVCFV